MKYLKEHSWITAMAVAIDFVAVKWWYSYLLHGSVYDDKHGLTFFGEASYGNLAGITMRLRNSARRDLFGGSSRNWPSYQDEVRNRKMEMKWNNLKHLMICVST